MRGYRWHRRVLGSFIAQLNAVGGIPPDGTGFSDGGLGGKTAAAVCVIIGIDGFGVPDILVLYSGTSFWKLGAGKFR